MAPRARPQLVKLSPDVHRQVLEGVEQAERGELADLTPAEAEHYFETGELPERVELWAASYDSRRGT
jgi:hypothetical protein